MQLTIEPTNRYLDPTTSTQSLLSEAKALLEQNGSLSEAALLLEAAIQRGELGEGGYEAWILLGEARNMDEHEEAGMRALVEGVRRGEIAGASGAGMLVSRVSLHQIGYDLTDHSLWQSHIQTRDMKEPPIQCFFDG